MGWSDNAFDRDVILDECERMIEGNSSDTGDKDEELKLGRHYLVFICQTWTSKGHVLRFTVARYCMDTITSKWLRVKIRQIIATLTMFGFWCNSLAFDGATENRSAMSQLLHLSLKEVLPELYLDEDSNDTTLISATNTSTSTSSTSSFPLPNAARLEPPLKKYRKDELNWNMKVALSHPCIPSLKVVASGDMPHCLKKTRNAIESSGKPNTPRHLLLDGLPINLKMAKDAWLLTPDAKSESSIRIYRKLSRQIFEPNAKSRMRVPDAARAQGGSIANCMAKYGNKNPRASPSTYKSYIEHCHKTDKWVDVMNSNTEKGCSVIDSPNHPHVYDLLDYCAYHERWKRQVGPNKEFYLTEQTNQDINWTSMSIAILARTQLPPGHTIVQRRSGSDAAEQTFCQNRQKNAQASAHATNQIMATNQSTVMMNLMGSTKANFGKQEFFDGSELQDGKIKRVKIDRKWWQHE